MTKLLLIAALWNPTAPSDTILLISSQKWIDSAIVLRDEENYQAAVDLLKQIPPQDSGYYQAQMQLFSTYNTAEWYDRTIAEAPSVMSRPNTFQADLYNAYGNAFLETLQLQRAREVYQEGLNKHPYHYVLRYNLGIAYFRDGRYTEAMECFQKSAKIGPYYSGNHLMLGYLSLIQGHRTKALLSYLTYLMINPTNNNVLVTLDNLVRDAQRNESTVSPFSSNQFFSTYDDLLRSRAAFDSRFTYQVKFDVPLVKQLELLLPRLKYEASADDFWMQTYLPMLTKIQAAGLSEAMIYFLLQSTGDEDVEGWLAKNKTQRSQWVEIANASLSATRTSDTATVGGVQDNYSFWYYNSNKLSAIGNQVNDDHYYGPWVFFHENQEISAVGSYSKEGFKIGNWKYYYSNGVLRREEQYNAEGDFVAPTKYYHANGAPSVLVPYQDDEVHGHVVYYYECGQTKEHFPYEKGQKQGSGQLFFSSGEKNIDYELKDGNLEGAYRVYYLDGQVSHEYVFVADQKSGPYVAYHRNGAVNEKGAFVENEADGPWEGYHDNGQRSYTGTHRAGERIGEWRFYNRDGKLTDVENYNDAGELHGLTEYHHPNGFRMGILQMDQGKTVGYQYFDSTGKVLSEGSDPSGNMDFVGYYWTGVVRFRAKLADGKLNGPYERYHPNGVINEKGTRKDGEWQGIYESFDEAGRLQERSTYVEGALEGWYQSFFPNGNVKEEGNFIAGKREQWWHEYYPDGTLQERAYYKGGSYDGDVVTYALDGKKWSTFGYEEELITKIIRYDSTGKEITKLDLPYGSGTVTYLYPSGKKIFEAEAVCNNYVATSTSWFPGGQINVVRTMRNSEFSGPHRQYAWNGTLVMEGQNVYNERQGVWKYYNLNGDLEAERYFRDGELDGELRLYHPGGKMEMRGSYLEGNRHGAFFFGDTEGNIQLVKNYDKDIGVLSWQYLGADGLLVAPIAVTPELEEIVAYFPNGKVSARQQLKKGVLHGKSEFFHQNGQLLERVTYQDGDTHGEEVRYFANGVLAYRAHHVYDELEGVEYTYHANGKLKMEATYRMGEKHGWERIYNEAGKVIWQAYYWDGMIYE